MISIIGAGPIGSYTAYLLAKEGYNVHLFEEHNEIGKPVQCTGILTSYIEKIIPLNKKFINTILTKTRIFSQNNHVDFKLKNNYIVDRTKFDQYFCPCR